MPISLNSNMGLSEPVRRFSIPVVIPQPIEGLDVPIVMVAEFAFVIDRVWVRTQDGDCEITLYNDGELIEFEEADTSGGIDVVEGAPIYYVPSSSDDANYTILEHSRLSFEIDLVSTILVGLELQIDCHKVQINDEGT